MAVSSDDQLHLEDHEQAIGLNDFRPQLIVKHAKGKYWFNIGTSNNGANIGSKCWVSWTPKTGAGRSKDDSEWLGFRTWTYNFDDQGNEKQGGRDVMVHQEIREYMNVTTWDFQWEKIEDLRSGQDTKQKHCKVTNGYVVALFGEIWRHHIVVCRVDEDRTHPDGRCQVALKLSHPALANYFAAKPDKSPPSQSTANTPTLTQPVTTSPASSGPDPLPEPDESAVVPSTTTVQSSPPTVGSTIAGESSSTSVDGPSSSDSSRAQPVETVKRGHQDDGQEANDRRKKRLRADLALIERAMEIREELGDEMEMD